MSANDLRRKLQDHQARARVKVGLMVNIGVLLSILFGWSFVKTHGVLPRLGWGLMSLWAIFFAYQIYRWMWPGRLAPEATARTSCEFYRNELERERDWVRHVWTRSGLPFAFLAMAMVVASWIASPAGLRLLLNAVPFFVLLAIWLAVFFPIRKRQQDKLQREIDELRAFETGDRP